MEKVRKFVEALWYNKERIVFGVMVCILFWYVYKIFDPPAEVTPKMFSKPGDEPPEDVVKLAAIPDPPEPRPIQQWEGIYTPNPFWYLSAQSAASQKKEAPADISLLQLQQAGGKWRARLKTNVTKWYGEGDSFESFQLLKINPEDNSVEVMSDRLGKVITLKAP